MKRNIVAVGMLLFFSAALWSCSDSDSPKTSDESVKQSLTTKAMDLQTAVEDITNSKGFEIITMTDGTKTEGDGEDTRFSANITLEDIKGIYDYNPDINNVATETKFGMQRVFERTDDSDYFVLRLPKEKAYKPWELYYNHDGSEIVNDFVITTTQYNYSFSATEGFQFDYLLDADIEVEGEAAGGLFVDYSIGANQNFEYEAEYEFTDDYELGIEFEFGTEIGYAYYLEKADEVLYKESIEVITTEGSTEKSYIYSLTIGNIEIRKASNSDEYEVYRDGVLEEGAVVEYIHKNVEDVADTHLVFCRKGVDIKITFADESEVLLSELLGQETLDKMDEIFGSMFDMFFVNHLVDKVAREVYYSNQAQQ